MCVQKDICHNDYLYIELILIGSMIMRSKVDYNVEVNQNWYILYYNYLEEKIYSAAFQLWNLFFYVLLFVT